MKPKSKKQKTIIKPVEIAPSIVNTPTPPNPPPSVAQKTWEQIRHLELHMFGLPFQTIEKYCSPAFIDPTKLYLTYKIGTVLPMMEEVLKNKFTIELADKYLIVVPVRGM